MEKINFKIINKIMKKKDYILQYENRKARSVNERKNASNCYKIKNRNKNKCV